MKLALHCHDLRLLANCTSKRWAFYLSTIVYAYYNRLSLFPQGLQWKAILGAFKVVRYENIFIVFEIWSVLVKISSFESQAMESFSKPKY